MLIAYAQKKGVWVFCEQTVFKIKHRVAFYSREFVGNEVARRCHVADQHLILLGFVI